MNERRRVGASLGLAVALAGCVASFEPGAPAQGLGGPIFDASLDGADAGGDGAPDADARDALDAREEGATEGGA